ncbi:MAG: hypothetical protein ACPMAQ_13165 [Phycisphaerae bacterium]
MRRSGGMAILTGVMTIALMPTKGRAADGLPQPPASAPGIRTAMETDDPALDALFRRLREIVAADQRVFRLEGGEVRTNPDWVRDHVHEMKAYKFWATDLTSYLDLLLRHQMPCGAFHEMIMRQSNEHATFVRPEFVHRNPRDGYNYIRLELEADIEYLMVEGAYQAWQATGDDSWLRERIGKLERGMEWAMTDPMRWDAERGLVKRPFTIDTWDFAYDVSDQNRRVEPGRPMAIMHGDNSGMYSACRMLARMWKALGKADRVEYWTKKAEHFREATNRVCWNGRFYTHQVHLPPSEGAPGVDERQVLSLSNPYDINRGLPDHAQALSILGEYRRRREALKDEYVCEWFSIHPPYPMFFRYGPGQYANGAIFPLVGGELCKAAFEHDRLDYAKEILTHCRQLVDRYGTLPFALSPKGDVQGGGPKGWGAAAFYSAIVEGLAGIVDETTQFRRIRLTPRWPAVGCRNVTFTAAYGPTGAHVAYRYSWNPDTGIIRLDITGAPREIEACVLLPHGTKTAEVHAVGRPVTSQTIRRESNRYVHFTLAGDRIAGGNETTVTIHCSNQ